MKKIVLLILTVVFWTLDTATAQNPKVTSTFNYLQYYDRDGETDNLMSALEAINLASKHEQTKGKGKTWYYRGQVYQKIFDNEEISLNYPEALGEAWNSYKTAIELNDPKFRYDKEALQNSYILTNGYLTRGFELYKAGQYEGAYEAYTTIFEIKDFVQSHGVEVKLQEDIIKLNTSLAAVGANKIEEAKKLLNELIEIDHDNPVIYKKLSSIYLDEKNTDEAQRVLAQGIAKYPDNIGLVIDELNIFLSQGKQAEALSKLEKAIELEPDNAQLYYAKGAAYGHLKDPDNARLAYEKAIEVDPKHYDAYNNLGAIFYNKAIELNLQMNELGFISSADQKKYGELETQRDDLYNKALPYFEKAYEIKNDQVEIIQALKEIYAKMGNYDKSNEMKARIEEVRSGK